MFNCISGDVNTLTLLKVLTIGAVGWFFIRALIKKLMIFIKNHIDDNTSFLFIINSAYLFLSISLLAMLLSILGVPTASLITILGTIGIALSLAVKDCLANIFGGIMLVVLKSFRIGDTIETIGVTGKVVSINLFNSILISSSGDTIYLPNAKVLSNKVIKKYLETK